MFLRFVHVVIAAIFYCVYVLNISLMNTPLCHYLSILLSVDRVIFSFVLVMFGGQNVKESQWMELLVPGVCEYLG